MAEEISSIGVRLTLDAGNFMSGMTAATEKTDAFIASTKKATTTAGPGGGKSTSKSSAAQNVAVGVDLTVSKSQLASLRQQIIAGIGAIPITVTAQMAKTAQAEAKGVVAAQITPAVGTRTGAAHTVETNVKQHLPKRATGGPVYPGTSYLVGERGPEVFQPARSGYVHANRSGGGPIRAAGGMSHAQRAAMEQEIFARSYDTFSRAIDWKSQADPKGFQRSVRWYQRQLPHLQRISRAVGLPVDVAANIVAEISSNNPWPNNAIDLMRLFPDSWRRDPNKKLSGPLATGRNKDRIWDILQGHPSLGVKKNPFSRALMGDPTGVPADVWMARLSRLTLGAGSTDEALSSAILALHGGGRKGGPGWRGGIMAAETRQIQAAINRIAMERGLEPRGVQSALWDIIRDRSAELGYSKKAPLRRVVGGPAFYAAPHGAALADPYRPQPHILRAIDEIRGKGWEHHLSVDTGIQLPIVDWRATQDAEFPEMTEEGIRSYIESRFGTGKDLEDFRRTKMDELKNELAGRRLSAVSRFEAGPATERPSRGIDILRAIDIGDDASVSPRSRSSIGIHNHPGEGDWTRPSAQDIRGFLRNEQESWIVTPRGTAILRKLQDQPDYSVDLGEVVKRGLKRRGLDPYNIGEQAETNLGLWDSIYSGLARRIGFEYMRFPRDLTQLPPGTIPKGRLPFDVPGHQLGFGMAKGGRVEQVRATLEELQRRYPKVPLTGLQTERSPYDTYAARYLPRYRDSTPAGESSTAEGAISLNLAKHWGPQYVHPRGIQGTPAEAIATHEFGHALAEPLGFKAKRILARAIERDAGAGALTYRGYSERYPTDPHGNAPMVSSYAGKDLKEAFAEYFLASERQREEFKTPGVRAFGRALQRLGPLFRQGGGFVDKFFHAAMPVVGPIKEAFATAAGWAKDPFMAFMSWQGQQAQGQKSGGYVGHAPMLGGSFQDAAQLHPSRRRYMDSATGPGVPNFQKMWWAWSREDLSRVGRIMALGRYAPSIKPHAAGGPVEAFHEAKRKRDYGAMERARRAMDPIAQQELEYENQRRRARGAVPLTMEDVTFDTDNAIFHASEPASMARYRYGKPKGGSKNTLQVDLRPWESILDEGGSWRWLGEGDPQKVIDFQTKRAVAARKQAAKAKNPDAAAWWERMAAEADYHVRQSTALQQRIAKGDLGWKGSAGPPSQKDILPGLEAAERNLKHYLDLNDPKGLAGHIREYERELQMMNALWAQAGGAPRPPVMASGPSRTGPGSLLRLLRRHTVAQTPEAAAMQAYGLRRPGVEETEREKQLAAEDEARFRAQRAREIEDIPKFHPQKVGRNKWEPVHENGHTRMMLGVFATEAEAQAAIDRQLENAKKALARPYHGPQQEAAMAQAVLAAPPVPHVKSPEQVEHERITELGLARRAEREAALQAQQEAVVPRGTGAGYPPSTIDIGYKKAKVAEEAALLERARKAGLFLRRARGGQAGEGLYIVNEEGPEAFLTTSDAARLGRIRPDIMSQIPRAADGARTGMIRKPAWSLFAPQKDGVIIPAQYAQEALHALRADGGWVGGSSGPVVVPGGFTPTGPIVATPPQHGMSAEAKAAEAALALAAALAKATTTIEGATARTTKWSAAIEHGTPILGAEPAAQQALVMPGQYEAGPIALPGRGPVITPNRGQLIGRQPLVAATMPPGFIGPEMPLRGMVAGGLATREQPSMVAATVAAAGSMGRAADASEANTAQAKEVWESIGKGLEGRGRGIPLGRQMVAADISKKEILKSFLGEAGDIRKAAGIEAPSGRSPAESQALRFGYVAAASERVRGGGTTDVEERMQQLRVSTAGAASFETARTPRGAAAVLGQLLGGGGLEFKRRQAELQAATTQWRARANEVVRLETDVVARQKSINFLREAGEDTSALDTELIDKQKDLAAAQDNHKKSLDKLEKAEKAVLPTTSSVVRSFGAIILATSAYGAAFSVANMVIQNGLIPTIGSLIDQLLGWQATATKTTTAMGDAAHQARGNYAAVLAQASANAGLSRGMMDFVSAAVEATVTAKAGARAQQETSNLYRTAMAGGPPEGLYGGYGGVLGSGLLAEQMGGGKGFTEIIAGDLLKGAGGLNLPLVGNLANAPEALNTAIQFLGSEDFRNTTMGQAKGLGIDTGIVGIAMDTIAEAGDALRGMDLTGMLPFDVAGIFGNGKDFISNFIGEATPPNEVPGVALGPERFVAPVLENLVDGGKNLQVYFDDLGAAAKRGAEAAGEAATGNFRLAKSAAEMQKAQGVAIAAGDINGVRMAQQGIVLEDAFGNVVTSTDQYQQIVEDMARGKNIVTSDVWAKQNLRQLQAQQQVNVAQTERQINIELPYDQMKQLLVSPILKPGASFFAAGMSGATAGAARTAIGGIPQLNQELQALASQGLAEARAQISQFNPEDLPKFDEASGMAQAASANIARFSNEMLRLNRIASQASWANQIRLANRALGDALGLLNRTGSTRMGQLQREEQMISRASTQLSLMLQQRQITTQVALAGFQAPGETGEERYMRQVERLAEADIAQQQLDLSKQNFSVSIQIWTENARRAATDAQKAINVMSAARNAEGYAIAAQERIAKEQQKLAIVVGRMDAIFGKARNSWNNALSAAAQGVGEFSGAVDDAIKEIYTALGYRQTRKGWVRNPRMESAGLMGSYSHGYLGAFARGATFTVGEAGPETVAILRNPRTHMLQGEGGSSGPSSVTVNINGPVVRGDDDITKLARAVAVEVERSLSKKGQLLGLRQPAY